MSLLDTLVEDTLHVILDLVEPLDRVRCATTCKAFGGVLGRFHKERRVAPHAFFFWTLRYPASHSGEILRPVFDTETCSIKGVLSDGRPYAASLYSDSYSRDVNLVKYMTRAHIQGASLTMELDLSHMVSDTFESDSLVACIIHGPSYYARPYCRLNDFFFPTTGHREDEWTPSAEILQDVCDLIVQPQSLTLYPDQRAFVSYFSRMERRGVIMLPLGSFPVWFPVRYAGQSLWVNVADLRTNKYHTEGPATFAVRNPPTDEIEFTSRIFWLCDESGMGKTVSMLALILGSPRRAPLDDPGDHWSHGRARRVVPASLVIAHEAMCRGHHSWLHLAKAMYPSSKVILVDSWVLVDHQEIISADLIIMPVSVYANHYTQSLEYPGPEDKPSILDYFWRRIVYDDYEGTASGTRGLSARAFYILTNTFPPLRFFCDKENLVGHMRYRLKGSTRWDLCPSLEGTFHLASYIMRQCMWRRLRGIREHVKGTGAYYYVPLSQPEHALRLLGCHLTDGFQYDVPCWYHLKRGPDRWAIGYQQPRTVTMCSLPVAVREVEGTIYGYTTEIPQKEMTDKAWAEPPLIRAYGSYATVLLILLKQHWTLHPLAKTLILCPSIQALLLVGNVIKEWGVPVRSLGKTKITYTKAERSHMRGRGKKYSLAILCEKGDIPVTSNRFLDVDYFFHWRTSHTGIPEAIENSLTRPGPRPRTLQRVVVGPWTTDSRKDYNEFPWSEMNKPSFDFVYERPPLPETPVL